MTRQGIMSVVLLWVTSWTGHAWMPPARNLLLPRTTPRRVFSRLKSSNDEPEPKITAEEKDETVVTRTSFDQAGASLIEEEDRKRLEEMGDFDANPSYQVNDIEKMRAAIRERTANLGMEKSQISAEYIQAKEQAAIQAGAQQVAEQASAGTFGGLDLSKISGSADDAEIRGEWNEELPTMFYDPEEEMSLEERQEVDPVMTRNIIQQGWHELSNTKWPTWGAAFREVLVMGVVVAFTAAFIIGADKILRYFYTNVGFIPTKEELANYASRFDGLDLPTGWMDNMNEKDVAAFSEKVNTMPPPPPSGGGTNLPEL